MPKSQGSSQHKTKLHGTNAARTSLTGLPNAEELSLLIASSGPVKNVNEAITFLEQRALIAINNNFLATTLANILFTVSLESKTMETNAAMIRAVGFLILHKLTDNVTSKIALAVSDKLSELNPSMLKNVECKLDFIKVTSAEQSRHVIEPSKSINSLNVSIRKLDSFNLATSMSIKELQPVVLTLMTAMPHVHLLTDSVKELIDLVTELKKAATTLLSPTPITSDHPPQPSFSDVVNSPPLNNSYPTWPRPNNNQPDYVY